MNHNYMRIFRFLFGASLFFLVLVGLCFLGETGTIKEEIKKSPKDRHKKGGVRKK